MDDLKKKKSASYMEGINDCEAGVIEEAFVNFVNGKETLELDEESLAYVEGWLFAEAKKEKKEKMDPVGDEDADIDNDGDVDASDEYLKKRRDAIAKSKDEEDLEEKKCSKKKLDTRMIKGPTLQEPCQLYITLWNKLFE